jgi:hypothetical protein
MPKVLLLLWIASLLGQVPGPSGPLQPDQGCSVLYATDGQQMLGGNNQD